MIGAFWNIKGLNKPGRSKCLCEFIIDNKLDFVGILESKKEKISDAFVDSICKDMIWNIVLANGTKGGILLGLKTQKFEVIDWQLFYIVLQLLLKMLEMSLFGDSLLPMAQLMMNIRWSSLFNCTMLMGAGLALPL
jgi:hypothetical protein